MSLHNVADYEAAAAERLDPGSYGYFAGGAGDEVTLRDNVAAYGRWQLRPRVLVDVAEPSTATTVLGREVSMPLLVAPMAYQRLAHPDGEVAIARAAAAAGTIMCLSTLATSTAEDVAATGAPRWFQLYVFRDAGVTKSIVDQARDNGFEALVVTVDAPVLGHRERDVRQGFSIPHDMPVPALGRGGVTPVEALALMSRSLTWRDVEAFAASAGLPVVVKGVMTAEDARLACEHGAAGLVVSNHGGRQLDGVAATIDVLPEVVEAVAGRIEVLVDGGIRRGADVIKALALGARAVLAGRAVLWGLAVGGEEGARHVLELLHDELELALQLVGARTPADLTAAHVQPRRPTRVASLNRLVKKLLVLLLVCLAVPGARASVALADFCGVPDTTPLWIDFAGHEAPIPAKPGMVLAIASGTETPAAMRAKGAATVFFDLNFNNRVGSPTKPADPATIADKVKREYDYAVSITGCPTPLIAENELLGAQNPTPWSDTNAQYRANTLALLQGLAAQGARPALLIANPPYTGGDAAEWWRQVSKVAILIRQVYFTAPNAKGLYALGPVGASRAMRKGLRGLVSKFAAIGIPSSRIAIEMQFNSAPGLGARAGLEPDEAWFEIVKLEALAAKHVATEFKLQGVWSWGWAAYSAAGVDPDKPYTACVWLWVRSPQLCNAPKYVHPAFNTSLTDGQLILPPGARCVLPNGERIERTAVSRLAALTGDPAFAASVLLERAVLRGVQPVSAASVASAERAVIDAGFGGSRPRYLAALTSARISKADALAIITDRLARDEEQLRFKPQAAASRDVTDFISTYAGQSARLVQASRRAAWLGGDSRGWVVSTLGPSTIFQLTGPDDIDTADGAFRVTPLGPTMPFALLSPAQATSIARKTLSRFAKASLYGSWLRSAEKTQLAGAICAGDNLPTPGPTELTPFAPFLAPS